jgi:hypothetical protein
MSTIVDISTIINKRSMGRWSLKADSTEKLLKPPVRVISIEEGIDGQISHPHGAIFIRGVQPFEGFVIVSQR